MKKVNNMLAAWTAVLLTATLICACPVGAQNDNSGARLFHLNATKEEAPSLTRDPQEMQLTHLGAPNAPNLDDVGSLEPLSKATPPKTDRPVALNPGTPAPAKASTEPRSYLDEYNVDWSGWISAVSSRWFYNLRVMESGANIRFVTDRPALIQFTCYADGRLSNIALRQSSGVDVYDRLQMLALSQVAPLPPFPAGTQCRSITLVQGWESHIKRPGESGFDPVRFGRGFPMEKVRQWVRPH